MGKFTNLQEDVFNIFATDAWKANNIPTYPQNFLDINDPEYIRISIVAGDQGVDLASVSGQVIIDIFTSAGNGPGPIMRIADILDSHLALKFSDAVQFGSSTLIFNGFDKVNPTLFRGTYSIPFNFFGA